MYSAFAVCMELNNKAIKVNKAFLLSSKAFFIQEIGDGCFFFLVNWNGKGNVLVISYLEKIMN